MRSCAAPALFAVLCSGWLAACSAGNTDTTGSGSGASGPGGTTGSFTGSGGNGQGGGVQMNECGTKCGTEELCDGVHLGLDDDCDGTIDEGCICGGGQASRCFQGDPAFLDSPGCLPGTMYCTELGVWGPCIGGKHAIAPDDCQDSDVTGCHPINGVPFQAVDLKTGTGTFSMGATGESFSVTCPQGVSPCPAPNGSSFQPLVSGEYTVTYTGSNGTCAYPLYVGARGLRVELSWNYQAAGKVDLDLHLHKPADNSPFSILGAEQDCGFNNCRVSNFLPPPQDLNAPRWFPSTNAPPDPVNWWDDTVTPNDAGNLCYFAPRGAGQDWALTDTGCHNPRLDLDNIDCDPAVTDPGSLAFCAPENINVDYPPKNQWFRVGVHFFAAEQFSGAVTPNLKIYCDGKLSGEVGSKGFHDPESPLALTAPGDQDKLWVAADVLFQDDGCSKQCIVQPVYDDAATKRALVQTGYAFGPPQPPQP